MLQVNSPVLRSISPAGAPWVNIYELTASELIDYLVDLEPRSSGLSQSAQETQPLNQADIMIPMMMLVR